MLHEPAAQSGEDPASAYKTRLGVRMFIPYALFYAGFVVLTLTNPTALEKEFFAGLNLAVVYGMGLIVVALILALIYNHLCSRKEAILAAKSGNKE